MSRGTLRIRCFSCSFDITAHLHHNQRSRALAKWIKRVGSNKSYEGRLFTDGVYRQIPFDLEGSFAQNSDLVTDIGSGDAILAKDDTGNTDITDVATAVSYLQGNLPPTILVQEEPPGVTGGHFDTETLAFEITHTQNTWAYQDFTYPYPISIFSTGWEGKEFQYLDEVYVEIAPDTIVGAIAANVAVNDTVITVSSTVLENIEIGYHACIDDGTNISDLGRVLDVDEVNSQITVETGATNAHTAGQGPPDTAYIRMTIRMVRWLKLGGGNGTVLLGTDVIGGSAVPANTIIRVHYKNVEGTIVDKWFLPWLEYKY